MKREISASIGALVVCTAGAFLCQWLRTPLPWMIRPMSITAKVLQLGVPLVTAAHVTRVIIPVTMTGPLFRLVRRRALRG